MFVLQLDISLVVEEKVILYVLYTGRTVTDVGRRSRLHQSTRARRVCPSVNTRLSRSITCLS